jgi:hypothetical protein
MDVGKKQVKKNWLQWLQFVQIMRGSGLNWRILEGETGGT